MGLEVLEQVPHDALLGRSIEVDEQISTKNHIETRVNLPLRQNEILLEQMDMLTQITPYPIHTRVFVVPLYEHPSSPQRFDELYGTLVVNRASSAAKHRCIDVACRD